VPSWLQLVDDIPKTISEKPQARLLAEAFDPRRAHRGDGTRRERSAAHGA
jgi:hypothetical protein